MSQRNRTKPLRVDRSGCFAEVAEMVFRTLFANAPIKRIGCARFVRIVLIAIGNVVDPGLHTAAARLICNPNPVVAEAAARVCARLESSP